MSMNYTQCPCGMNGIDGTLKHSAIAAIVNNGIEDFPVCYNHIDLYHTVGFTIKSKGNIDPIKQHYDLPKIPSSVNIMWDKCNAQGAKGKACRGETIWLNVGDSGKNVFAACEAHLNYYLEAKVGYSVYVGPMKGKNEKTEENKVLYNNGKCPNESAHNKCSKELWNVTYKAPYSLNLCIMHVCTKHLSSYKSVHNGYTIGEKVNKTNGTFKVPLDIEVKTPWIDSVTVQPTRLYHLISRDRGHITHYVTLGKNEADAKENFRKYCAFQYGKNFTDELLELCKINEVPVKSYMNASGPVVVINEKE